MMSTRLVYVLTIFLLSIVVAGAALQVENARPISSETQSSAIMPDARIALGLRPAIQESLMQTMREHLESLHAIIAALTGEKYEQAARIAHQELGFPKHHQIMQRERGATFPPRYQELAMAHHRAAEDLAEVIPTMEMKRILQKLDQTIKACVDCHQAYKL